MERWKVPLRELASEQSWAFASGDVLEPAWASKIHAQTIKLKINKALNFKGCKCRNIKL